MSRRRNPANWDWMGPPPVPKRRRSKGYKGALLGPGHSVGRKKNPATWIFVAAAVGVVAFLWWRHKQQKQLAAGADPNPQIGQDSLPPMGVRTTTNDPDAVPTFHPGVVD